MADDSAPSSLYFGSYQPPAAGASRYSDIWQYILPQGGQLPGNVPDKYKGIINPNYGTGDSQGSLLGYNIDWSKLPAIQGGMTTANQGLTNPNLVFNDPNYGPITPYTNAPAVFNPEGNGGLGGKISSIIPMLAMAGVTGAIGSIAAPGIAADLGIGTGTAQGGFSLFNNLGKFLSGLGGNAATGVPSAIGGAAQGASTTSSVSPVLSMLAQPRQTGNRNLENLQLLDLLNRM